MGSKRDGGNVGGDGGSGEQGGGETAQLSGTICFLRGV